MTYQAKADFSFRDKFIELAITDNILDKNEIKILTKLAYQANLNDPEFAKETVANLAKYKTRTKIEYTIFDEYETQRILNFTVTPTYSENDKINGKNAFEIVSNISQRDSLDETTGDSDRCAAASVLNSYLLVGGNFATLAKKYSINTSLTYKNLHLLQEKLYKIGNTDNKPGIYSGFKYSYYETGRIFNIRADGEIVNLAKAADLKIVPILGNNLKNLYNRKEQVNNFFNLYPKSTIQSGVYLNLDTGNISKPLNISHQNHVITIFKHNGSFYYSDTGNLDNGDGKNVKKMTSKELEDWLYKTPGIVLGLYI